MGWLPEGRVSVSRTSAGRGRLPRASPSTPWPRRGGPAGARAADAGRPGAADRADRLGAWAAPGLLRSRRSPRGGLLRVGRGLGADHPSGAGTGVAYLGIGHHASEALRREGPGAHLAAAFGIEAEFVDRDNPV